MKALLVIWFFTASGGHTPIVTKMDSMEDCESARQAMIQSFPWDEGSFTKGPSGLRPERLICVPYGKK